MALAFGPRSRSKPVPERQDRKEPDWATRVREERRDKERLRLHRHRRLAILGVAIIVSGALLAIIPLTRDRTSASSSSRSLRSSTQKTAARSVSKKPEPVVGHSTKASTIDVRTRQTPVLKPHIVWNPIPYGPQRRAEMAAYAKRHYGINTWHLDNPKVIVEHYTGSTTFSSAYATFSADTEDRELHELPGDCAHFVIDSDGTIYQLVPLNVMCRHTVGLNYTAIGIEQVGVSDTEILHNPRQLQASLSLTIWLMKRFGIQLRNVIGHSESLTSPYHHELYSQWRCQTHGDWTYVDMQIYRTKLSRLVRQHGMAIGAPRRVASSGC